MKALRRFDTVRGILPKTQAVSGGNRIPSLDGLRAVSIGLVLMSHASITAGIPSWWAYLPSAGGLGVRTFFVISGFLITTLLIQEERRAGRVSLPGFYRRRFFRIIPVLWSYIGVVFAARELGLVRCGLPEFVHAMTFTTGLFESKCWELGHLWSLSIEEQFYIVWPVTFVVLGPSRAGRRLWLGMAAIAMGPVLRLILHFSHHFSWISWSILGNQDSLAWGCTAALAFAHSPQAVSGWVRWRSTTGRLLAALLIALFEVLGHLHALAITVPFACTVQSAAIAYLICSLTVVRTGLSYWLLNLWIFVRVGTLSYGIYLWQELFLVAARPQTEWWRRYPTHLILVGLVAIGSYYLIEKPFLRLKGKRPRAGRDASTATEQRLYPDPLTVTTAKAP